MQRYIDYENLKVLLKTNNETFETYKQIKSTLNKDCKDILYIYETAKEADYKMEELLSRLPNNIKRINKNNRIIELKDGRIFIWTLNQFIKRIDGYKFRSIRLG